MLAEDFGRTVGEQEGEQLALREICEILTWNNKNYSDLHLPVVDIDAVQYDPIPDANPNQVQQMMDSLNAEQREFVDRVILDIAEISQENVTKPRLYFIEGPGGSGKTFVYNTLLAYFHSKSKVSECTATSFKTT